MLPIVNVNTQPSLCHYAVPLIRLRHMINQSITRPIETLRATHTRQTRTDRRTIEPQRQTTFTDESKERVKTIKLLKRAKTTN